MLRSRLPRGVALSALLIGACNDNTEDRVAGPSFNAVVASDTVVRVYASHSFSDGTLGPFTGLANTTNVCNYTGVAGQCSADVWLRNGALEIRYMRMDATSSGDRNRGIKWVPKDTSQHTKWGKTLYVRGTWTIPSVTPAVRAQLDSVAARLNLAPQTDTAQELLQRKLIYGNPGRNNHFVLKIHTLKLQFVPGVGDGPPCSATKHPQPVTVHRFKDSALFDIPQRIELEIKRSSGVRVADGEAKIWVNGVLVRHITGFCTNHDTNQSWQLQIGQQMSYAKPNGVLFNEIRRLDDVLVANRRP